MINNSDSGISSQPPNVTPFQNPRHSEEMLPGSKRQAAAVYARLPIPTMSSNNIEAWFTSMDFWFTASGITSDKQKVATVFAALDPTVIGQLSEVIASMPQQDRFEYVKAKIIEHFADSEQRRLNRLLSELPLGDKKPSELYFEMKRVAGNTLGEAALKGLWTKRLPEFAQPVVAASSGSAAEFTKIADSIIDAVVPHHVNVVESGVTNEINQLRATVEDLGKRFDRFSVRSRSRQRSVSRYRPRSTNRSARVSSPVSSGSSQCWYHQKYGTNARKCRSPCRYRHRAAALTTEKGEQ